MKLKIKNGRKVERERGEGLKKNNKMRWKPQYFKNKARKYENNEDKK